MADAPQVLLAFDVGRLRLGVAKGNQLSQTAEPLATLECAQGVPWDTIAGYIDTWAPDALVVGLPLTADGQRQAMTDAAERFARRLHGRYALPVALADERYSSLTADTDTQTQGRDAAAARQILLGWMAEQSQ